MASGLFGKADLKAATGVILYTVGSGLIAFTRLRLCNRGKSDATVKIAVFCGNTPTDADWVEYGAIVPAKGGVCLPESIPVSAGESIYVESDSDLVTVRADGLEQTA